MTFAHRMIGALAAEDTVLQQLIEAGWKAIPFGQGTWPIDFRMAAKLCFDEFGHPSLARWLPDIIACKPPLICMFDVKYDSGKTENYSIELKALEALEASENSFHIRSLFIFEGLFVLTPEIVRSHSRHGRPSDEGSGTPYVLINKRHAVYLDTVLEDA